MNGSNRQHGRTLFDRTIDQGYDRRQGDGGYAQRIQRSYRAQRRMVHCLLKPETVREIETLLDSSTQPTTTVSLYEFVTSGIEA